MGYSPREARYMGESLEQRSDHGKFHFSAHAEKPVQGKNIADRLSFCKSLSTSPHVLNW